VKRNRHCTHQCDVEALPQSRATRTRNITQGDEQMTMGIKATRIVLTVASVLAVSLPSRALAQSATVCGPEVKAEVSKALSSFAAATDADKLAFEKELYAKYQFCAQDAQLVSSAFL